MKSHIKDLLTYIQKKSTNITDNNKKDNNNKNNNNDSNNNKDIENYQNR